MSSKRRPLSASFKKTDAKGTSQRSRPSSARSSVSGRHNLSNSFKSDISSSSGLSVTGTRAAQSRPTSRQRQSPNSSSEKKLGSSVNLQSNPNNVTSSAEMLRIGQPTQSMNSGYKDAIGQKKESLYGLSNAIEILEAEKDDEWWKNIPKDINFSPSTSFSYSSSRSEKTKTNNQRKDQPLSLQQPNKLSSSVRNPSLNDFLDLSDDMKSAVDGEISRNDYEHSREARDDSLKSEENSRKFDEHFEKDDSISGGARETSGKAEQDILKDKRQYLNAEEDSRKVELQAWKAEVKSWKDEPNSRKSNNEYKASDFLSNSENHVDDWSLPSKVRSVLKKDVDNQESAALTIQRWYRGYKTRLEEGHSAIQKVLEEKRALREQHKKEEERDDSMSEKQRRREEKARLARQAAIQELNHKRERKKDESKRIAEEELKFLEESGKVVKAKNKVPKQRKAAKKTSNSTGDEASIKTVESPDHYLSRPGSGNTVDSKVEELFQESQSSSLPASSQKIETGSVSEATTSRTEGTAKNSVSGTKSTLDDLFESLRQLEEEPGDLKKEQKPSVYDWLEPDAGTKIYDPGVSGSNLTKDAVGQSGSNSSLLSQEKLRTIMSYLDEVEQTDQDTVVSRARETKTIGETSMNSSLSLPRVDAEKELALLESASAAASDVTNAMMSVKVELEEKKKTNDLLQRALNQQREFSLRQARDMEKDAKQRLGLQRQEYESTIQRHLSFIDQLIDDKKILSERCEELVKKLKETDKKYVDKITKMEESHAAEMKKQKDIMQTAEKLRREKWVKEKSQQIKELTVKGLEPDIQKLIAKHKAEIKKLKSSHQAELLESDERAGRRYLHQIEELRDQLEREKETACNRERDLAQTRFQKQMEEEEKAFQQQRRRLYAEIQDEKERLATQAQKQRKELDELREKLEQSHKLALANVENSSKQSLDVLEQKHQAEMKELKERLEIEKQQWIENYMKKQDAILLQKERELKEGVRESRDKEIELVIRRLEDETALARDECERASENRIKRVRDKYESEFKDLERSERTMHEKYTSVKDKNNELDEEVSRLKVSLKNEERKLEDLKKLTGQLQEERGQVVDIIRQEFADRLVTTDEDNKRLKIEISELRAKHRLEIERITKLKEEEMEEVHKRVKQAISKKEETLNAMRQQKESAEKRADHLEFLLQEQRKKLLS